MRKKGARFSKKRNAMAGIRTLSSYHGLADWQKNRLWDSYHVALERLRLGNADSDDLHGMAGALNIALVLCDMDIGKEHKEKVQAALEELGKCYVRGKEEARWVLQTGAYPLICAGLAVHDAQLEIAQQKELRVAISEVTYRMLSGYFDTPESKNES